MSRRSWLKDYLSGNVIFKGLAKFYAFSLLVILLPFPDIYALVLIFLIATLSFIYSIYVFGKLLWRFSSTNIYPNDTLTGYFIISIGGFLFGMTLVTPALLFFNGLEAHPVTIASYLITLFYVLPVWAFFLVARIANKE